MFEHFLSKTPNKEASPATARQARHTTEKYSLLFSFCARRFFSSKRKRVFFCGVLPSKYSGRWQGWPHFDLAREKRNSPKPPFRFSLAQTERERKQAGKNSFPPTPFLFARLLGLRPQNFSASGI